MAAAVAASGGPGTGPGLASVWPGNAAPTPDGATCWPGAVSERVDCANDAAGASAAATTATSAQPQRAANPPALVMVGTLRFQSGQFQANVLALRPSWPPDVLEPAPFSPPVAMIRAT